MVNKPAEFVCDLINRVTLFPISRPAHPTGYGPRKRLERKIFTKRKVRLKLEKHAWKVAIELFGNCTIVTD